MPRKAVKKRKRASSVDTESSSAAEEAGKRSGALSKFKEFDVSEVLQRPIEENSFQPAVNTAGGVFDVDNVPADISPVVQLAESEGAAVDGGEQPAQAPHLASPEHLRESSPEEELVPLPSIQVAPVMNRYLEAQSGLLKEPGPPASLQRVTQPGELAPAMPTALMQLLSG